MLFLSALSFAQQNSGFRVIGRVPNAGDNRLYQIQVGAFRHFQNAEIAYQRLNNASFNPAYDYYLNLTRVVINGVAARDVPSYLQRIQNSGFTEIIIRIERNSAAVQPPDVVDDRTPIAVIIETSPSSVPDPDPVERGQQQLPPATSGQLLPAPEIIQPESSRRIEAEDLLQQRNIHFSWSGVEGATGYILIIREKSQGRESFIEVAGQTDITIDDLTFFKNNGDYAWHVEAIRRSSPSVIEQRGRPSEEHTLIIDVRRPGQVNTIDTVGDRYAN